MTRARLANRGMSRAVPALWSPQTLACAGELFSDDDLYMMGDSQLTVTSTTLHLLDDKIYKDLIPETLVLIPAGS